MTLTSQTDSSFIDFVLFLADTNLILGQRNAEWCAHGPILEQDIAITNISLDLIGQARNFYQYAAKLLNEDRGTTDLTEDSLAYLRTEREFKNVLMVELPNQDWAHTVLRQFFYSVYSQSLYQRLLTGSDEQLAAIAEKSLKEITYHVKWSSEWVIRLGDGTDESRGKMQIALKNLWPYTGEFFMAASYETSITDYSIIQEEWNARVNPVLIQATLEVPQNVFMQKGGKQGIHTEHMGFILTELQYLQRTYPGAEW